MKKIKNARRHTKIRRKEDGKKGRNDTSGSCENNS